MSLNDPFGRVSRRRQHAYGKFREQLYAQGVATTEALDRAKAGLDRTAGTLTGLIIAATTASTLWFSTARGVLLVCGCLSLLWLGTSYLQTRAHLNRYRYELKNDGAPSSRADAAPPPPEEDLK